MNEEIILGIGVGMFAIGFGIKHYRKLRTKIAKAMEDGDLNLSEALDIVEEMKESIEEIQSLPSLSALKRMRKDDLIALCAEHNVDTEGTKAVLIEKLKESVK